jgi:hypothetical protein
VATDHVATDCEGGWRGRPTGLPDSVPPPSVPLSFFMAAAFGLAQPAIPRLERATTNPNSTSNAATTWTRLQRDLNALHHEAATRTSGILSRQSLNLQSTQAVG